MAMSIIIKSAAVGLAAGCVFGAALFALGGPARGSIELAGMVMCGVFTLMLAMFIGGVLKPRRAPGTCRSCGYPIVRLPDRETRCPECGEWPE